MQISGVCRTLSRGGSESFKTDGTIEHSFRQRELDEISDISESANGSVREIGLGSTPGCGKMTD
jgi:hypothetical protein